VTEAILSEQLAYYRARAGEYDDWFYRRGRYDWGAELNARWFAEADIARQALRGLGPVDTALELACGTGIWTEKIAQIARQVTALDGAPEVLELNRLRLLTNGITPPRETGWDADGEPRREPSPFAERGEMVAEGRMRGAATNADDPTPHPGPLPSSDEGRGSQSAPHVTHLQADLFAWEPDRGFDLVVFCFWLSHVPDECLDAFLDRVRRATRPGGRFFLLDSRNESTSMAKNHDRPTVESGVRTRKLNDGREFRVVKLFHDPDALAERFRRHGFESELRTTPNYFLYGFGTRR
jgi:ubiquinone/menaquinone biosynthesis C-methylase UbiE